MTRALILAVAALAFASPPPAAAQDAPRLKPNDCVFLADMALTARALAVEKVDKSVALRVMEHAYSQFQDTEAANRLRPRVVEMAYARSEEPMQLMRIVAEACMRSRGDVGAIFGTPIRWLRPAPRGLQV